jgi:DNA polymerase-3 subunit epsilon
VSKIGCFLDVDQRVEKISMQSLAVLDFETANHQPNSACQLGIVIVEPWKIIRQKRWMIRPRRLYFSPRCVQVHGITPEHVLDAPSWEDIWSEVLDWIDGSVLIAHNAGFDANVLMNTCLANDIALPPMDVQCTRLISKRSWPALRSHSLASMAEFLSIDFAHHDALEDAKAASCLLIEAASKFQVQNLEELEDRLGLVRGRVWSQSVRHPRTVRRSRIESVAESPVRYEPKRFAKDGSPRTSHGQVQSRGIVKEILMLCSDNSPIAGKHMVLIGTLLGLDRQDSVALLSQLGANVQSQINLQTQYIIQGTIDQRLLDADASDSEQLEQGETGGMAGVARALAGISSRRKMDIESRGVQGQSLTILSQRQLLAMLPSGLEVVRGQER